MTWLQRAAVVVPLSLLAITAATLGVIALQPEWNKPWPKAVILPAPAPKSLIVWLEYELTYSETAFKSQRQISFQPVAWYAGEESEENLIAERVSPGRFRWGPMAMDTEYEIAWRGLGEIHLRVPEGATEAQVEAWKAEVHRVDPGVVGILPQTSAATAGRRPSRRTSSRDPSFRWDAQCFPQ